VVAGSITTQPKQGRRAVPMSSLSILFTTVKSVAVYAIASEKYFAMA